MAIEFRCPNGHRLSCPDQRAGMSGKCPKCKATFRVPKAGESAPSASDSAISQAEPADAQGEQEGLAVAGGSDLAMPPRAAEVASQEPLTLQAEGEPAGARDERIVFLCPNGHKLNSKASMQGRPGKCPHCGATFLVPEFEADDDREGAELAGEPSPIDELQAADGVAEGISVFNGDAYRPDSFPFDFSNLTNDEAEGPAMAGLLERLWVHKQAGGIIELYLKGGEVIAPEWFASRHSNETYGMFAFPENDGSFTLTAVNWEAIERIAVRGVTALPRGMFDEAE